MILKLTLTEYLPVVSSVTVTLTVTVVPLLELRERDLVLAAADELLELSRLRLLEVSRPVDIAVGPMSDSRQQNSSEKQHVKTCAVQATGLSVSAQE